MRLTIGPTTYDLTTRAIIIGVGIGVGGDTAGADLVDLDGCLPPATAPLYAAVADDAGVGLALSAGAALVRLHRPSAGALALCAAAGASVVVPAGATAGTGLPPERAVPDTLLVDVTTEQWPAAAAAVGVIRGARLVRTADVAGSRRVCDVLAAVLEAR